MQEMNEWRRVSKQTAMPQCQWEVKRKFAIKQVLCSISFSFN